ncbi:hypothetical protein [Pseudomonas sp. GM17]|uniref:hypothetical protein n=1 Tax=Pseudomonas sp. GM17 TaxID=1144323 RepID=UPI00056420F2|nr:hypothetical protein [Pseudomonas sp. GM17]WIE48119.1 hypothetical protein PMI20_020435 [Pseudomonas sp. GM17]
MSADTVRRLKSLTATASITVCKYSKKSMWGSTVHIDDTDDWLGIPTPLEIATQHGALLENSQIEAANA